MKMRLNTAIYCWLQMDLMLPDGLNLLRYFDTTTPPQPIPMTGEGGNSKLTMKASKPILKLIPPSPWLQKTINGIEYWVHTPSRKGGIHIRGLARLCGVHISTLQNAIKRSGEVTEISPIQQGGPVKAICADVCADLIHYYGEKGHEAAIKSALAFMRFGIEQFIFIKVGFIPRPESIMLNDIEFLIAKETVQVNKTRQEEARFFTNPITGEYGIALQSLGFLCGGVAIKHIETFLERYFIN